MNKVGPEKGDEPWNRPLQVTQHLFHAAGWVAHPSSLLLDDNAKKCRVKMIQMGEKTIGVLNIPIEWAERLQREVAYIARATFSTRRDLLEAIAVAVAQGAAPSKSALVEQTLQRE